MLRSHVAQEILVERVTLAYTDVEWVNSISGDRLFSLGRRLLTM